MVVGFMDGAIYNSFSLETIVLGIEYYCRIPINKESSSSSPLINTLLQNLFQMTGLGF
jgi:hypothetical protein